jgi:hypothetical protein
MEAAAAAVAASDVAQAAVHLDAACTAGHIPGCVQLAMLEGAEQALRTSAAELACDAGEADGCLARAQSPDDRWTTAACDAGRGSACLAAAAVTTDPRTKARLLAQACHGAELAACLPAADAWRALGDATRSAALAAFRCSAGQQNACALSDAIRDEAARSQACAAGDVGACEEACLRGQLDACEEAREALQGLCEGRNGVACTRLGQLQLRSSDVDVRREAGATLWRACDAVDPWACWLLADWADAGNPLPPAARGDAAWLRDQACDLQLDYACAPHGP